MAKFPPQVRKAKDVLEQVGLALLEYRVTGKSHFRLKVSDGARTTNVTTPCSPSNGRWGKHLIADARRGLRAPQSGREGRQAR